MVNKDVLSAKLIELADRAGRVRARTPAQHEHGALSATTAEALGRAVGLRNVVAHGYSRLDIDATYRAASAGLADIDACAREVSAWAGS